MKLFELLKDPAFAELDNAHRTDYYNEHHIKSPKHIVLPNMTLYHKKKRLTKGDIAAIMEWYDNGLALGVDYEKYKDTPKKKSENTFGWFISQKDIDKRDELIRKEIEFRNKIVDEYFNDFIIL